MSLIRRIGGHGVPRNTQKSIPVSSVDGLFELKTTRARMPYFYWKGKIVITHVFFEKGENEPTVRIYPRQGIKERSRGGMKEGQWFLDELREYRDNPEFLAEGLILEFNEEICRLMEDQGLSRADLARRLGVKRPAITRMLNGSPNVTLLTLVKFATALNRKLSIGFDLLDDQYVQYPVAFSVTPELETRHPQEGGAWSPTPHFTQESVSDFPIAS